VVASNHSDRWSFERWRKDRFAEALSTFRAGGSADATYIVERKASRVHRAIRTPVVRQAFGALLVEDD
jgi:hypothetical protein